MSSSFRTALGRKAAALLAAPVLLGSVSAAAPLPRVVDADVLYYTEQFYSDASYSVKVGAANGYCDGDYIMKSGYATAYSILVYRNQCP
jgi:hypothetical protein